MWPGPAIFMYMYMCLYVYVCVCALGVGVGAKCVLKRFVVPAQRRRGHTGDEVKNSGANFPLMLWLTQSR